MQDIAFLIGRLLLGGYFVLAGIGHLRGLRAMAGYAASKGVPFPQAAVLGTAALLLAGGLSIAAGFYPLIGIGLIALFLIGVTPKMHDFWRIEEPMQRMGELVNFQKNVALLGAVVALAVVATPWPLAV